MSKLSQSIAELKTLIGQCETELTSLQAGRKASAARVRSSLQQIKTLSHKMRGDIMIYTRELPTKTRTKKNIEPIEAEPRIGVADTYIEPIEAKPIEPVKSVKKKIIRAKK